MQAVAYTKYGGPEVTQMIDLPVPTPAKGEVLLRVAGGGLNPVDYRVRSGDLKALLPYTLPHVAGDEVSGEITALGAGVTSFKVGDKVIARQDRDQVGALAQQVVVPASLLAHAPKSIPLADAAGLPLAGLTAVQGLDLLKVKAGDHVLITAGSGGVGLYAIQLAKLRGAHVTTTASSAGEALVQSMGADVVIDYKSTKLSDVGTKWSQVFDCAGGDEKALTEVFAAVSQDGHVVSIAGPPTVGVLDAVHLPAWKYYPVYGVLWLQGRGLRAAAAPKNITYTYFFMHPDAVELQKLADLVDAGKLKLVVDSKYKFGDFKEAFARLESKRSKGKVIVEVA